MTLTGLAWRNLLRRPLRTVLSMLGVALAVGSTLALVALSYSIQDSTRAGLDELGSDLAVTQRGAPDFFGGYLSEDIESKIAEIPGVARVAGELFMFAPTERERHVLASGWPEGSAFWTTVPLREGRLPQPGERRAALIGDVTAEALDKRVGDELEVSGERFRIVGVTRYASLVNRGLVILTLKDFQDATYRNGQVTFFRVTLRRGLSGDEVERVRRSIASAGKLTVSMTSEVLNNDRNLTVLKAVSLVISIIAMAMGIVNVLNTLLMTIQERTREIGIVAALGWSDRLIVSSIVIEGLIICAGGCVLGVALGYLASQLFYAIPSVGDFIEFRPTLGLIMPTVLIAFALCTIGSFYPAWRAIRLKPAEALQRA